MGDFVPKWNFDQKSIQNPSKWLSSLMSKLWISAIFDQNSQKNKCFSQILDEIFVLWKRYCVQWIPQILRFSKMCLMWIYHIWNWFNQNFGNWYGKFMWVWKYSWFWHLTGVSFGWVLFCLLIKVSFRYKIAKKSLKEAPTKRQNKLDTL